MYSWPYRCRYTFLCVLLVPGVACFEPTPWIPSEDTGASENSENDFGTTHGSTHTDFTMGLTTSLTTGLTTDFTTGTDSTNSTGVDSESTGPSETTNDADPSTESTMPDNSRDSSETGEDSQASTSETGTPEACVPHSRQCLSSTHIQFCDAQGNWDPPQACIKQAWVGDQCSGECFPDTTQCLNNTQVQTCSDLGLWGNPTHCEDQTCFDDQCQGQCAPDQRRCQGPKAQSFNALGQWDTEDLCRFPDQECVEGGCIACQRWTRQFGTAERDAASGITVDSAGMIYATGSTFTIKFTPDGATVWEKDSWGEDIALNPAGSMYLTQSRTTGSSPDSTQVVLTKLDKNGNSFWTRELDAYKEVLSPRVTIAMSKTGLRAITWTDGEVEGKDIILTQINSLDTKNWTQRFEPSSDARSQDIVVDDSGSIYLTGGLRKPMNTDDPLQGYFNAFVAKFSAEGTLLWAQQLGVDGNTFGRGIAVDNHAAALYITGSTESSLNGEEPKGNEDVYVAKFNLQGNKLWTTQWGSPNHDGGTAVAVGPSGKIYISANSLGALDGGTSAGKTDAYVLKLDADGTIRWTQQLGTPAEDIVRDIVVDHLGRIYVAGSTDGALHGNIPAGQGDAFVARICND